MIKFVAHLVPKGTGEPPDVLLGIILTYTNLDRLRAGDPIMFEMAELNENAPEGLRFPPGKVMIAADESEEKVLDQFAARGVDIGVLRDHKTPYEAQEWLAGGAG